MLATTVPEDALAIEEQSRIMLLTRGGGFQMHHRFRVSAGLLLVLVAAAPWAAGPAAGQAPAGATQGRSTKPYTPPRTPDGQPDLQGFWTNSTYTPLERPKNVTKEFYTPAEAAEAEKKAAERETEQTDPGDHGRRAL